MNEQGKAFGSISFKLLAHDVCFGGPDGKSKSLQICQATGIGYNRLSNCCNSNQVHFFSQDEIAAICNSTGDFRLIEDLCRKCSGTFKRFNEVEINHADVRDAEDQILELIGHLGRLSVAYKDARRDNRVSQNECSTMDRLLLMIREGAVELSGTLNRMVK